MGRGLPVKIVDLKPFTYMYMCTCVPETRFCLCNRQILIEFKGSSWAEVGGVHEKYVNKKNVKNISFSEKA